MRLSRPLALTLFAALAVAALPALPAAAVDEGPVITANRTTVGKGRCAKATNTRFSGTLRGQDGLAVNTTIGFDLVDKQGRKIDLRTGCRIGAAYSWVLELNHFVDSEGQPLGTTQSDGSLVSDRFSLQHLPANAVGAYVEAYPRARAGCAPFRYTGTRGNGTFTGCTGKTDVHKYGRATRRNVPVGRRVTMTAPLTPAFGGSTGEISVVGAVRSVYVRSEARDGALPLQGWGTGERPSDGSTLVKALASGQTYVVVVTLTSGRTVEKRKVAVRPGQITTVGV